MSTTLVDSDLRRWLGGLFVLCAVAACAAPESPDLVLISLDTVRADAFRTVAKHNPVLRDLVADSVGFRAGSTPTPLTLPAHVSLMSALDPNRHGVRNNGQRLGEAPTLLAERLRDAGYATGAVVSAFPLDRQFGLSRGFAHYDQPAAPSAMNSDFVTLERGAQESVQSAVNWLSEHPERAFLWLHLFDAHAPYAAPGADRAGSPRERYLAEIDHMGRALKTLIDALENRGRPFVLVVVADHGEGLGDHDELDHGLLLYDSTLLVPMYWYAPEHWKPRQIDQIARLIDVAPTLLEIARAEPLEAVDGVSLLPLLEGKAMQLPEAYAETYYPSLAYHRQPLRSIRSGQWKSIGTIDVAELFNVYGDPAETIDQAGEHVERLAALQLQAWNRPEPTAPEAARAEAARALQGLGYLAAGSSSSVPLGHPGEVVASHRRLVELQNLMAEGDGDAALAAAQQLVVDEPDNGFAAYVLGALLLDRGQMATAIVSLQRAVELDPTNPQSRFKLAESLLRSQRFLDSLPHWQALELLDPERVAVWTNEAAALAALGNWKEAHIASQRGLELAPDDVTALDNATVIAERLGRWEEASTLLVRQASLEGESFRQLGRLSLLLARAGQYEQARRVADKVEPTAADHPLAELARALAWHHQGKIDQAQSIMRSLHSASPQLHALALRQFPELKGD